MMLRVVQVVCYSALSLGTVLSTGFGVGDAASVSNMQGISEEKQYGQDRLAPQLKQPRMFLWDANDFLEAQLAYRRGNAPKDLKSAVAACRKNAEAHLSKSKPPLYVVTKQKYAPPSGDRHDYFSTAFYAFPCDRSPCGKPDSCDTNTGMPWVKCDGHNDPSLVADTAKEQWYRNYQLVTDLAFAYWYTGEEKYAVEAARQVRAFFVNPDTRMNPHLQYAQAIPGTANGTRTGAIEFIKIADLLDAVGIISLSGKWTANDESGLKKWCNEFLDWLLTSDLGKAEHASDNNHGTWYTQTTLALALHTGNDAAVRRVVHDIVPMRVNDQITDKGIFPHEMARPWSRHYEAYVLMALFRVGLLAQHAGLDIFKLNKVKTAAYWPVPHLLGKKDWPYKDTNSDFNYREFGEAMRVAGKQYNDPVFEEIFARTNSGGYNVVMGLVAASLAFPVV